MDGDWGDDGVGVGDVCDGLGVARADCGRGYFFFCVARYVRAAFNRAVSS